MGLGVCRWGGGGRQVPGQRSLCPKQAEDRRAAWLGRRVRLPSVSTGLVRVALGDESTTQALRAQLRRASHPKPPSLGILQIPWQGLFSSETLRDFAAYTIKGKQMSDFFCSTRGGHQGDGQECLARARLAVKHSKLNTWVKLCSLH